MADKTIKQLSTEYTVLQPDDWFLVQKDSDGVTGKAKASSVFAGGNIPISAPPDTVTHNGNRSYSLVFNSLDLTGILSKGMRLKLTRTTTAPTQCTDLESSSSHYYAKTSPAGTTFTDDAVAGAWVKLESYPAWQAGVISRYNGTSGWELKVGADGTVQFVGYNASSANFSRVVTYVSLPLNKWVHIAAQLDMSAFTATTTTSYVMIDGVDVPAFVSRGGTNPTALVQAGNLNVGATNSTTFFDGKLAQVFYSSAKITQANIRTLMGQGLTASLITTHSIVSAYSFSNSINDLNTTSANNLTAQNSAVATATDSPFAGGNVQEFTDGTIEWGIVASDPTFSTNTTVVVQVPEGYALPTSGGISAAAFSTQKIPYGFPADAPRWWVDTLLMTAPSQSSPTNDVWYNMGGVKSTIPIGSWGIKFVGNMRNDSSAGNIHIYSTLSTSSSAETIPELSTYSLSGADNQIYAVPFSREHYFKSTSETALYALLKSNATGSSGMSWIYQSGTIGMALLIRAEFAYL